jgi:NO-binding membrane sensor protein with MHYT domain
MQVDYASSFIGLSLIVTVALSFVAIYLLTHRSARKRYVIGGGTLAGLAMAAMHYTGMEALKIEAIVSYDTRAFLAALLLTTGLATGALWIGRNPHTCRGRNKWLAAGLLGAAI